MSELRPLLEWIGALMPFAGLFAVLAALAAWNRFAGSSGPRVRWYPRKPATPITPEEVEDAEEDTADVLREIRDAANEDRAPADGWRDDLDEFLINGRKPE